MAKRHTDIDFLLSALLLFSVIIGLLHSNRLSAQEGAPVAGQESTNGSQAEQKDFLEAISPSKVTQADLEKNPLSGVTLDQAMEIILPLLESEDVERLVEELTQMPMTVVIPILKQLLNNEKQFLNRPDRIKLLIGIAAGYKTAEDKNRILDFIVDSRYLYLRQGDPIIYIAAASKYSKVIPDIKTWYAKKVAKQFNRDALIEKLESNALMCAVDKKDLTALKIMKERGVKMSKRRMGHLLHEAVRTKAGRDIIEFILDQGANVNVAINGYIPLMLAVKNNDLDTVELLVARGADGNKVIDNTIGSALQIAETNEFIAIQEYLLEHGADQ